MASMCAIPDFQKKGALNSQEALIERAIKRQKLTPGFADQADGQCDCIELAPPWNHEVFGCR